MRTDFFEGSFNAVVGFGCATEVVGAFAAADEAARRLEPPEGRIVTGLMAKRDEKRRNVERSRFADAQVNGTNTTKIERTNVFKKHSLHVFNVQALYLRWSAFRCNVWTRAITSALPCPQEHL
jgi:hypothetical protein